MANREFPEAEKVNSLLESHECIEGAILALPEEFYISGAATALTDARDQIEYLIKTILDQNKILRYENGGATAIVLTTPTGQKLLITCS